MSGPSKQRQHRHLKRRKNRFLSGYQYKFFLCLYQGVSGAASTSTRTKFLVEGLAKLANCLFASGSWSLLSVRPPPQYCALEHGIPATTLNQRGYKGIFLVLDCETSFLTSGRSSRGPAQTFQRQVRRQHQVAEAKFIHPKSAHISNRIADDIECDYWVVWDLLAGLTPSVTTC